MLLHALMCAVEKRKQLYCTSAFLRYIVVFFAWVKNDVFHCFLRRSVVPFYCGKRAAFDCELCVFWL